MDGLVCDESVLQDFLTEAAELLSDVDNKLVELERRPGDLQLLNDIFRGFHTIKGGAGFLNANALVELCHLTENLFDKLRNGKLSFTPKLMDVILAATASVRVMFESLSQSKRTQGVEGDLLERLREAISGKTHAQETAAPGTGQISRERSPAASAGVASARGEPDWDLLYRSLLELPAPAAESAAPATDMTQPVPAPSRRDPPIPHPSFGRRSTDNPAATGAVGGRRESDHGVGPEISIRVDTARLDQVLNLSGEIGLTKNRLSCLRTEILRGRNDEGTVHALDEAVNQLNLLVSDLQNAVMKTRMQPVGRLFQKYPRMVRDLARQLGKKVELHISGEGTELDKTMIEELGDPLVHLVRNAIDHGVESPEERLAQGKPETGAIRLCATQAGDHILIEISDDGRGMSPELLRRKALEKGLINPETVHSLDERESLQLIFLPGLSTKEVATSVSGRGVGMDVVKTNIQKVNGRVEIESETGVGTRITITLPLTLAILPVLLVRLGAQAFAVPLMMVRKIIPVHPEEVQAVSGAATLVVRGEVLPLRALADLLGWSHETAPAYGVLIQSSQSSFVLGVDGFIGREDLVVKPLDGIKPKGVAGATMSGDGAVVLVLDMEELLQSGNRETSVAVFEAVN